MYGVKLCLVVVAAKSSALLAETQASLAKVLHGVLKRESGTLDQVRSLDVRVAYLIPLLVPVRKVLALGADKSHTLGDC